MQKKNLAWGWIILLLLFFWPVGLYLVVKKISSDKSALMSSKTGVLLSIAWFLNVVGGIGFIGSLSKGASGVGEALVSLIFIAGGILLLRRTKKIKKTAAKYKQYIELVINQNIRSIDNISSALALPYDIALKDLQDMINNGYLKDAYVHQGNREIVLKQAEQQVFTQATDQIQVIAKTASVRCSGCGANNVVSVGKVTVCEYCETSISA